MKLLTYIKLEVGGSGIGRELVKKLLDYCLSRKINWVGLIAEPNQNGFYSNIGFKTLTKYTPMKYEKDD